MSCCVLCSADAINVCARCKRVKYCSKECQKSHWVGNASTPGHKNYCYSPDNLLIVVNNFLAKCAGNIRQFAHFNGDNIAVDVYETLDDFLRGDFHFAHLTSSLPGQLAPDNNKINTKINVRFSLSDYLVSTYIDRSPDESYDLSNDNPGPEWTIYVN